MTKASEWATRVAAWRASGQSAAEYCAGRGYSPKTLQWWSSRLRRHGVTAKPQVQAEPVRLARVVPAPPASAAERSPAVLLVEAFGARVQVPPGTDRATLAAVFEALGLCAAAGAR